jgi:hypothetical protein
MTISEEDLNKFWKNLKRRKLTYSPAGGGMSLEEIATLRLVRTYKVSPVNGIMYLKRHKYIGGLKSAREIVMIDYISFMNLILKVEHKTGVKLFTNS